MNQHVLEEMQIVSAFVPVNLAAADNNGDWVSLKNYGRCTFILFKGAGGAGEDPVFTLEQATAVAGTSSKALTFTRIDKKVGGQTTASQFTTATQSAAGTHTDAVSGEAEGLFVVDVMAEDLDVEGGFDCVRLVIPDVGTTAQLACGLYLLREPRFAQVPLPGAITD